jgi:hypothetical protein
MKKKNFIGTYTKFWVTIILIVALLDMQLSYVLAFIGMPEIAESLSVAIATEIVGVMLGYFIKSFLETHSEEKNKLERELNNLISDDETEEEVDEEEINLDDDTEEPLG